MRNNKKVLIIPRHQVILKFLELPSSDRAEIEAMSSLQALKDIPLQKEEIVTGFRIMNSDKNSFSNVMLAIAKRDTIEEIVSREKKFPGSIRIETEILYLYLREKNIIKKDEAALIISVKEYYSEVVVIDRLKIVFSRGFLNSNNILEEMRRSWAYYGKDVGNVIVMHCARYDIIELQNKIKLFFQCPIEFHEQRGGVDSLASFAEINLLPERENTRELFLTGILLFIIIILLVFFPLLKSS